jgi:hypothetical protein
MLTLDLTSSRFEIPMLTHDMYGEVYDAISGLSGSLLTTYSSCPHN